MHTQKFNFLFMAFITFLMMHHDVRVETIEFLHDRKAHFLFDFVFFCGAALYLHSSKHEFNRNCDKHIQLIFLLKISCLVLNEKMVMRYFWCKNSFNKLWKYSRLSFKWILFLHAFSIEKSVKVLYVYFKFLQVVSRKQFIYVSIHHWNIFVIKLWVSQ